MRSRFLPACLATAFMANICVAGPLVIVESTPGELRSRTRDGVDSTIPDPTVVVSRPPEMPLNALDISEHFISVAGTTYTFSESSDTSHIEIMFTHQRASLKSSFAQSIGEVIFDVNSLSGADVSFQVTGFYQVSGDQIMKLQVEIVDDAGVIIFHETHKSVNTPDESFVIGLPGGDEFDVNVGSPFGILENSKRYRLRYDAFIQTNSPAPVSLASAEGSVILQLTSLLSLPSDYNFNGVVDAADYTVWRDMLGQTGAGLAADGNGDNMVTQLDYDFWKAHFGETAGAGSGSAGASPSLAAMPEPASAVLALLALAPLAWRRPESFA